MRAAAFGLVFCLLLLNSPARGQQTQNSTASTPALQDPQAVAVLNQTIAVAGGIAPINAIADYTATGNITYNWSPQEQGSVTILGLGLDQIRLDANLVRGIQSSVISPGQISTKNEYGKLTRYPLAYPTPSSDAYEYQSPVFPASLIIPQMPLASILNSPKYSVAYKGVVQLDGNPVQDVLVELVVPGQAQANLMAEYQTVEFFIDAKSFQIVMTQDNVPKHIVRQIWYSDYTPVKGVLVPFSITEQLGGQKTRDIQLSQINFNTGLQGSAFVLQ
jgi:hypothetical protein